MLRLLTRKSTGPAIALLASTIELVSAIRILHISPRSRTTGHGSQVGDQKSGIKSQGAMKMLRLSVMFVSMLMVSVIATGHAEARPDTRTMTCDQLRSFVKKQGAAVIDTGPHTYQRFVYHRGFCLYSEQLESAWVPALDGAQCRLRICEEPTEFRKRRGRRR
jgi:hypothetical protein